MKSTLIMALSERTFLFYLMLFEILCFSNCNLAIAIYILVSHLYCLVTSERYIFSFIGLLQIFTYIYYYKY